MTMQITINVYFLLFLVHEEFFNEMNLWVEFFFWEEPLPIKIVARERRSIVSTDDSIWVETRHEHECVVLS